MIEFAKVKEVSIPEGMVAQIVRGAELLWKKAAGGARFGGYTGTYSEAAVEIDGAAFTLYTLTTSGTLTVEGDGVLFWMCGGGGGGKSSYVSGNYRMSGNGGGGGYVAQGQLASGEYAVVIGTGGASNKNGTATTIGEISAAGGKVNGNGGSGGGGAVGASSTATTTESPGTGQGVSTIPFGLTALYAHSAGGGAGGAYNSSSYKRRGGYGGSDGSDGYESTSTSAYTGGTGGAKGGGKGGDGTGSSAVTKGSGASFYGGGGGGGGAPAGSLASGGTGYQGVVYIAVPA